MGEELQHPEPGDLQRQRGPDVGEEGALVGQQEAVVHRVPRPLSSIAGCHVAPHADVRRAACRRERALEDLAGFLAPRQEAEPGFRWTVPEQWHVTLAFLAEVPDRHLDDLIAAAGPGRRPSYAVRGDASPAAAPSPDPARAKVLFAGVETDGVELGRLATGVRAAASRRPVPPVDGGRFHPHVTLARDRPARSRRPGGCGCWTATGARRGPPSEVALVASHLGEGPRRRPRYEVVETFPLAVRSPAPDGNGNRRETGPWQGDRVHISRIGLTPVKGARHTELAVRRPDRSTARSGDRVFCLVDRGPRAGAAHRREPDADADHRPLARRRAQRRRCPAAPSTGVPVADRRDPQGRLLGTAGRARGGRRSVGGGVLRAPRRHDVVLARAARPGEVVYGAPGQPGHHLLARPARGRGLGGRSTPRSFRATFTVDTGGAARRTSRTAGSAERLAPRRRRGRGARRRAALRRRRPRPGRPASRRSRRAEGARRAIVGTRGEVVFGVDAVVTRPGRVDVGAAVREGLSGAVPPARRAARRARLPRRASRPPSVRPAATSRPSRSSSTAATAPRSTTCCSRPRRA